jgi:hypothetical protein
MNRLRKILVFIYWRLQVTALDVETFRATFQIAGIVVAAIIIVVVENY